MKSLGLKLMWVSLGPVLGVVGLAVLVMLTVWQRRLSAAIEQRRKLLTAATDSSV